MLWYFKFVRIVTILQGVIAIFFGLILFGFPIYGFYRVSLRTPPYVWSDLDFAMQFVYIAMGFGIICVGIHHLVASRRLKQLRSRGFVRVVLLLNLLFLPGCFLTTFHEGGGWILVLLIACCMFTGLPVVAYGMLVLSRSQVKQAFAKVAEGATPREVLAEFRSSAEADFDDEWTSDREP